MSIVRTLVRIAAVNALRGATYAEDRVYDSRIGEIDTAVLEERRPLITVTTDDQEGAVEGGDLRLGDHALDLVIETAIATSVEVEVEEDDGTVVTVQQVQIPDTDAGYELTLDVTCGRILRTLQYGGGEWGDIYRDLVTRTTNMIQRRGADSTKGARFAARQIVLTILPLADPIDVLDEDSAILRCLDKMAATPNLATYATVIRGELADDPVGWTLIQKLNGWSDRDAAGVGYTPPEVAAPGQPGFEIDNYSPGTGIGSNALPPEDVV